MKEETKDNIGLGFAIGGIILLLLLTFTLLFDAITVKDIRQEKVPCLDKYDRPFENELCTRNITCSVVGLVGDMRCSTEELN